MGDFLDKMKKSVEIRASNLEFDRFPKNDFDTLDFVSHIQKNIPSFISEIKFASPSLGQIYSGRCDHVQIADSYLNNGAAALSILTEPEYFLGNIHYVEDIRKLYPNTCILLKDFILYESQILQAKAYGASAALLIVGFIPENRLKTLYDCCIDNEITPFVEVHNEEELEVVLDLSPRILGINNRDLKTLNIDMSIWESLIDKISDDICVICESGIDNIDHVIKMRNKGVKGFLIGTSFMKKNDPGLELKEFVCGLKYFV